MGAHDAPSTLLASPCSATTTSSSRSRRSRCSRKPELARFTDYGVCGPGHRPGPRSRPSVASRSSWNWIHTRWQESGPARRSRRTARPGPSPRPCRTARRTPEPAQPPGQRLAHPVQRAAQRAQRGQDPVVPALVGVVVGGQRLARGRADLPVRAGRPERSLSGRNRWCAVTTSSLAPVPATASSATSRRSSSARPRRSATSRSSRRIWFAAPSPGPRGRAGTPVPRPGRACTARRCAAPRRSPVPAARAGPGPRPWTGAPYQETREPGGCLARRRGPQQPRPHPPGGGRPRGPAGPRGSAPPTARRTAGDPRRPGPDRGQQLRACDRGIHRPGIVFQSLDQRRTERPTERTAVPAGGG